MEYSSCFHDIVQSMEYTGIVVGKLNILCNPECYTGHNVLFTPNDNDCLPFGLNVSIEIHEAQCELNPEGHIWWQCWPRADL